MGLYFVDDTITPERIKEVYLKESNKEIKVEKDFVKWIEEDALPLSKSILEELRAINAQK